MLVIELTFIWRLLKEPFFWFLTGCNSAMWHKHGLEVVSWVLSLTVEFIDWEVTWKFLSEGATHSL